MADVRCWDLGELKVEAHSPVVLHSDDGAERVIALALPAGEELGEHQVHENALVFVIEGELGLTAGDQERTLAAPGLAQFAPAERHAVRALSDSRLLLCLSPWPGEGHPSRRAGAG